MDIPSTILFGLLLLWLIGQLFNKYGDMKMESGLTAIVLVAILFYGRNTLLGSPANFWHTVLKLFLDFLLVTCIGSGITAMLRSKNPTMALFNFVWCGGLTAGLLKLMKVW
jgi:hypothetical protein